MNNYTVTLCIIDRLCCNATSNTIQKEVTISDLNTTILLQKNYSLNILNVDDTHCTILLQDGINTYILNVYTTFPTEVCIGNFKNSSHKITISCSIDKV